MGKILDCFRGTFSKSNSGIFLIRWFASWRRKVPETKIGLVVENSKLYQSGLRTGDLLVGVNDEKVTSFDDLNIKGSIVETITVKRQDSTHKLQINLEHEAFINEFISIISTVRKPIFVNLKGEKYLLSLDKNSSSFDLSLEEIISKNPKEVYLTKILSSTTELKLDLNQRVVFSNSGESLTEMLSKNNFYPLDLVIRNIVMGSPADKAGLRKDDILVSVDGAKIEKFEDLRSKLQGINKPGIELTYISQGKIVTKNISPEEKTIEKKKVKLIGIESAVEYVTPKLIEIKEDSIVAAVLGGFTRTWDGIVKTFSGYKKLFMREVSLNNIGGPLAIGKVASDSFNISLSMFFRLMAIISINLGVINLFPIPVLDGGHIVFLIFEAVNGGPLSRRKLEIAQRFGMSVLFLLIFVALFNDFSRLF